MNLSASEFHKYPFPVKLDHVEKTHAIDLNEKFKSQLITINKARNCFVHRHGIVSDKDITNNEKLEVKWIKLQAVLQDEDGEKEVTFPFTAEKDGVIAVKQVDAIKSFDRGTSVEFSVK